MTTVMQAKKSAPDTANSKYVHTHRHPLTWASAAISHVGNVRKLNEDAYLNRPDLGIWVIADGMGGHSAGDYASNLTVRTLCKVSSLPTLHEYASAVEGGLQIINQELVTSGLINQQITGSTVVGMLARNRHCIYMWVGDSRAYLLRKGTFTQMTTDHSQVQMYVDAGVLTREEAKHHRSANILTRALGVSDDLQVEAGKLEMQAGDRFLLCSDGLYKYLTDEEMAELVAAAPPELAVQNLLQAVLLQKGNDNITAIIIEVSEAKR